MVVLAQSYMKCHLYLLQCSKKVIIRGRNEILEIAGAKPIHIFLKIKIRILGKYQLMIMALKNL